MRKKALPDLPAQPIREKWQTPCASMMLVVELGRTRRPLARERAGGGGGRSWRSGQRRPEGVTSEFLWFGDCAALLEQDGKVEIVGEALRQAQGRSGAGAADRRKEKNLPSALGVNRPRSNLCCGPRATASTAAAIGCSRPMRAPPPMSRTGPSHVRRRRAAACRQRWLSGAGQRLWRL